MEKHNKRPTAHDQPTSEPSSPPGKKQWQDPKLSFVKPKLTIRGKLQEVAGQFFGAFSPGQGNPPVN